MILYIIRHAWAEAYDDPAWPDDRLRPLTAEGQERFARVVAKLAARGFEPQIIASSPLVRCRQTAELVAAGVPGKPGVVLREELAPQSDLAALVQWTARQSECESAAWVGHAPDVGLMAAALVGGSGGAIDFAKGAVAAIRFDDRLAIGAGELRWLVTARILGVEK